MLAIDIPIGLPERNPRECDGAARKLLLPPRASSVFPAPIRKVLRAETWEEASKIMRRVTGHGMSKQAWGIVKKVREVDAVLRDDPGLQQRVREVHPEVSFWAWNGEQAMRHSKKTRAGRAERMGLIARHFGKTAYDRVWAQVRGSKPPLVAADDVVDASAALWTAERIARGQAVAAPPRDARGLRMEIVY